MLSVKTILTPHYGQAVTEHHVFIRENIHAVVETRKYINQLFKTGLMGYMADILQYARDIRPFHETVF